LSMLALAMRGMDQLCWLRKQAAKQAGLLAGSAARMQQKCKQRGRSLSLLSAPISASHTR
jgi:hypothetical protein